MYTADGDGTMALVAAATDVFMDSETTDCPITKCDLVDADLKAFTSPDAVLATEAPWGLKITNNKVEGYTLKFGYQCTNDK